MILTVKRPAVHSQLSIIISFFFLILQFNINELLSVGESSYILLPEDGNETLVDKSLDEPAEKPAEKPTENPIENPIENPTENPTEKPAEESIEEPTASQVSESVTQQPELTPELDPNALQVEVLFKNSLKLGG